MVGLPELARDPKTCALLGFSWWGCPTDINSLDDYDIGSLQMIDGSIFPSTLSNTIPNVVLVT